MGSGKSVHQSPGRPADGDEADKKKTFDEHLPGNSTEIEEMADAICATAEATKNRGDLPAGVRRWIESMRKPKVPWQRVFHKYRKRPGRVVRGNQVEGVYCMHENH